jgi:hypothetical protein
MDRQTHVWRFSKERYGGGRILRFYENDVGGLAEKKVSRDFGTMEPLEERLSRCLLVVNARQPDPRAFLPSELVPFIHEYDEIGRPGDSPSRSPDLREHQLPSTKALIGGSPDDPISSPKVATGTKAIYSVGGQEPGDVESET